MTVASPPSPRKRILVTNDDGIQAKGIQTLIAALEPHFEVWVVAPDREQSARSHALTLHRPLRMHPMGERRFGVDGTPTDAVYLGVVQVLQNKLDLLISGINHGPNLSDDVTYSGTVSAALEATLMGIPAIAISCAGDAPFDFGPAAEYACELAKQILERPPEGRTFLNVNVPNLPKDQLRGVRVTRLGLRRYGYGVEEKHDPRGRPYYWLGTGGLFFNSLEGSDCDAIHHGYISVTPLDPDMTDHQRLTSLDFLRREG